MSLEVFGAARPAHRPDLAKRPAHAWREGSCRAPLRREAVTRAAAVADLAPDVLVLQERARGTALEHVLADGTACWFGANPGHGWPSSRTTGGL